ncbi:MAG: 3D domain-containing protein [Acidobacteria bacterium]|nr:3D domain-containing protein [Acidobacteriota bacterium]
MNLLPNNGMNRAFTSLSVMTLFAFGCIATLENQTTFAQEKKASIPTTKADSINDNAMELPGIFKEMPNVKSSLTQKSAKPVAVKRLSNSQFVADSGKGIFGVNLRRNEKRAALAVARNLEKREATTILIPPRNEHWDNFKSEDLEKLNATDFHATAYCLKGRTATGEYVRQGLVAADPKVLPLGTMVHIQAGRYTGIYKVADTGGAIRGNRIDIYVPSYREAKSFGRQKIKVKVIGRRKP